MDAAGIQWTILSGFRDDYRQSIAAGFKAHPGNSFHGGSNATGGYGHGCAVDLARADGESNQVVWQWLDVHGAEFGLQRPLPRIDPAHVQPRGTWHELAAALRSDRIQIRGESAALNLIDDNHPGVVTSSSLGENFTTEQEEACTHARLKRGERLTRPLTKRAALVPRVIPTAGDMSNGKLNWKKDWRVRRNGKAPFEKQMLQNKGSNHRPNIIAAPPSRRLRTSLEGKTPDGTTS